MGLFKRKKKYDDIDEALLAQQEDLFSTIKKRNEDAPKPNVLTANEITGEENSVTEEAVTAENPLEAVRRRMLQRQEEEKSGQKKEPSPIQNEEEPEMVPFFNVDTSFLDDEEDETLPEIKEEVREEKPLKKGDIITLIPEETADTDNEESILQNCLPFIMDGRDRDTLPEEKPSYTLESVASILGIEEPEKEESQEEEPQAEAFEETIIFKAIEKANMPDISDIDTNQKGVAEPPLSFTGTMPVIINDEMIGNTRDVDIFEEFYQNGPAHDSRFDESPLIDEDDSFEPEDEYVSFDDRKKIRFKLLKERRSRFLKFSGSLLSLIILGVFLLPIFSDLMISFSPVLSVFTGIGFIIAIICNIDIFKSFITLGSKRTSAETVIALSAIFSFVGIILSFVNTLASEVPFGLAFMTVLSLFFRAYWRLRKSQYMYNNFIKIATNSDKYAITLIDDAPTTFAMARKAIDGDVLIAAKRRTRNITDFMKNSTVDKDFDGKAKLLFFIALGFSVLSGLALGFYRDNFMTGIVAAGIFSGLFAPLTTLACNIMPMSGAAGHLKRYGAALTGVKAARQIEQANACVLDCNELFPKGSIRLADMKILSENNLEETIAMACAITSTVKSPLAPVFKTIMETNKEVKVPVADSIKYEERLGITGWVGDKRIFIGNRTLMLAHEIAIPDAEVDKKILRDGYFPVYLACDGKALALIVLRYIPDPTIAKELDRITAMGLTLLISNCDQNISEEMICDYFDLYSDCIKVMSGSGVHMYKTAVNYTDSISTGAAVKKGAAALAATVFAANRVKKAVSLLQIVHYITIVIGVIIFSYMFFGNASLYILGVFVALYELICFVLGSIAYLFTKP